MSKDSWDEMENKAAAIRKTQLEEVVSKETKRAIRQKFLASLQVKNSWSRAEMAEYFRLLAESKSSGETVTNDSSSNNEGSGINSADIVLGYVLREPKRKNKK